MPFVKILVPVDFSYHATGALRLATYLANRWSAAVTILHIDPLPGMSALTVEPVYIAPQLFAGLHAEHDTKVQAELRDMRAEVMSQVNERVEVTCVHRLGDPVPGIVEFAAEWSADLIVMGSQGIDGIGQYVLGSTADRVSRIAPCPVLIAGRTDDRADKPRRFERVIAGIDYSDFSEPVANVAASVVEPSGTVELTHVWNPPYLSALSTSLGGQHPGLVGLIERARTERAAGIRAFADGLHLSYVNVEPVVAIGSPDAELLSRASESDADLLVLGAHRRVGFSERVLGTVADRILRRATLPVLLCPQDALPATLNDQQHQSQERDAPDPSTDSSAPTAS